VFEDIVIIVWLVDEIVKSVDIKGIRISIKSENWVVNSLPSNEDESSKEKWVCC
jgi:hypothetical protein